MQITASSQFSTFRSPATAPHFPLAAVLCGCLLVSACATQRYGAGMPAPIQGERVAAAETTTPTGSLSEANLVRILAGELYGYQGYFQESVRYYLEAARSTRDPGVLVRGTHIALHTRDYEAAEEITRLWLELDDKDPDVHRYRLQLELRTGDKAAALRHLEALLEWEGVGHLRDVLRHLVEHLDSDLAQITALHMLRDLDRRYLLRDGAAAALLELLPRLGDFAETRFVARRLVDQAPRTPEVATAYIAFLRQGEQTEAAWEWLEDYLGDDPQPDFELSMIRAELLYAQDRYAESIQLLETLERSHPENPELLYRLALIHMVSGRPDPAEQYFLRIKEDRAFSNEAYYYLAVLAEEQDEKEKARHYYGKVQAGELLHISQARAIYLAGTAGHFEEARRVLQELSRQYWDSAERRNLFISTETQLLLDMDHGEEALAVYDSALERLGYDAELLYMRAMVADRLDLLEQMEQDLRSILDQEPDHVEALNALGYTLADRTDRYEEAYQLIRRALELSDEPAHIIDSMGWVLYRLERLNESLHYLRRAYEEKRDAEIAAHLGEVLWQLGHQEDAREVLQEALQKEPEHKVLLRVMRRFTP